MQGISARARHCVVWLGLAAACGSPVQFSEPSDLTPPDAARALFITPTKGTWTWEEVAGPEGSGVTATLTNGSERSFLSIVGDKFNSATEQAHLFVAKGGSAAVEWRDPEGEWRPAALVQLVEGVKPVLLRRGGNYALTARLLGPRRSGLYRIRVDYVEAPDGTARHSDYSPPFEIR